jgi:hypothetical protein
VGNGALVFVVSAMVLWILARKLGGNVGPAVNTLLGASTSGSQQPGSFIGPPDSAAPGAPSHVSYQPNPVEYEGLSYA